MNLLKQDRDLEVYKRNNAALLEENGKLKKQI